MPVYEYRCQTCRRKVSILTRSVSATAQAAVCDRCGSRDLVRLVSSFAVGRSAGAGSDESSLDDALADVDERDPRSLARAVRRIGEETGEDMGPEFDEAVGRLEEGEDPEATPGGAETKDTAGETSGDDEQ
ncbi:MAG: FmdB family zinc ribbon protein [Chloroflexota bacterium]